MEKGKAYNCPESGCPPEFFLLFAKTFTSTTRWAVHEHALDMQINKQKKKKTLTHKLPETYGF